MLLFVDEIWVFTIPGKSYVHHVESLNWNVDRFISYVVLHVYYYISKLLFKNGYSDCCSTNNIKIFLNSFGINRADCEKQVEGYYNCKFKKFSFQKYGSEEKANAAVSQYMKQKGLVHPIQTHKKKACVYAVAKGRAVGIFFKK